VFPLLLADGGGGTQAVEGSRRSVVAAFHSRTLCFLGEGLLGQAHDRLEEVVVGPQSVVELVGKQGLGNGVEAVRAEQGTHEGGVLLFDDTVVILLIGSTARQTNSLSQFFPEVEEVVVEEGGVVVGMNLDHVE